MGIIQGLLLGLYFLCCMAIGFYQLMNALYRLMNKKHRSRAYKNGLRRYLLSVTIYLGIFITSGYFAYYKWFILYLFVLPFTFMFWYIIYTRKWDNKHKNIHAYDQIKLLEAPHPDRLELEALPHKVVQIVKLKSKLKLKTS